MYATYLFGCQDIYFEITLAFKVPRFQLDGLVLTSISSCESLEMVNAVRDRH